MNNSDEFIFSKYYKPKVYGIYRVYGIYVMSKAHNILQIPVRRISIGIQKHLEIGIFFTFKCTVTVNLMCVSLTFSFYAGTSSLWTAGYGRVLFTRPAIFQPVPAAAAATAAACDPHTAPLRSASYRSPAGKARLHLVIIC